MPARFRMSKTNFRTLLWNSNLNFEVKIMKKFILQISLLIVLSFWNSFCSIVAPAPTQSNNGLIYSLLSGAMYADALIVPTVSSTVSPTSAFLGETITFTGTGLHKVTKVTFSSTTSSSSGIPTGTITEQSSTTLKVTIPYTAATGLVSFTYSLGSVSLTNYPIKRLIFATSSSFSPTLYSGACSSDSNKPTTSTDSKDLYRPMLVNSFSSSFSTNVGGFVGSTEYYTSKTATSPVLTSSSTSSSTTTTTSITSGSATLGTSGAAWLGSSSSSASCSSWSTTSSGSNATILNTASTFTMSGSGTQACNTTAKFICVQYTESN
jgi:hypothetical protein